MSLSLQAQALRLARGSQQMFTTGKTCASLASASSDLHQAPGDASLACGYMHQSVLANLRACRKLCPIVMDQLCSITCCAMLSLGWVASSTLGLFA